MITGTIVAIDISIGRFVVRLDEYGGCALFSLADGIDLDLGCEVSGHLDALGGETLLYLRTGQRFEAVGETGATSCKAAFAFLS
jgi:hypothetical protein